MTEQHIGKQKTKMYLDPVLVLIWGKKATHYFTYGYKNRTVVETKNVQ